MVRCIPGEQERHSDIIINSIRTVTCPIFDSIFSVLHTFNFIAFDPKFQSSDQQRLEVLGHENRPYKSGKSLKIINYLPFEMKKSERITSIFRTILYAPAKVWSKLPT
ncbi:hypothetical protein Agabi119p4_11072 [Agaricus bisporus var. burnettii]|uniref:Uncharacterized protein n=1 Tax=Agaricus bisporus var. burnettii TaxID=192524 RepID=A0A8H7C154_AGABI|nr:hypothetical protein Agabi119p4_11072 [Agaricus bisporus var. burnettii]